MVAKERDLLALLMQQLREEGTSPSPLGVFATWTPSQLPPSSPFSPGAHILLLSFKNQPSLLSWGQEAPGCDYLRS